MNILAILLVVMLSFFSTGVMSYVAMATPLGPWIEPTIVLCVALLLKLLSWCGLWACYANQQQDQRVRLTVLITAGSSMGGIIATAMSFSFPAMYFLDANIFNNWFVKTSYFCFLTSSLALVGSLFGFWIANLLQNHMLDQQRLMFPVGQLAYRMVLAQNQARKARELAVGFLMTCLICCLQILKILPKSLSLYKQAVLCRGVLIPWLRFDFFPMYWAVGFVTGHIVAVPLLIGALAKIFLVDPINTVFFQNLPDFEFMLPFCSGLMIVSTLLGLLETPQIFWETVCRIIKNIFMNSEFRPKKCLKCRCIALTGTTYLGLLAAFAMLFFFLYFEMPFWIICYLGLFTFICAYQVVYIAGKIGLAQLGRFATFVMLPAVFLFRTGMVNAVFISTFVELAAGVAADTLFGLKMGRLAGVPSKTIKRYQFFGLLISCAMIGFIFWSLINKFGLGTEELFVQRAQTRALLINATKFNPIVILLGILFALFLKIFNANPMLVLSGLLMPINVSISLIAGGFLALWIKHKEEWYPFWSGVFAAHSMWMVISALVS